MHIKDRQPKGGPKSLSARHFILFNVVAVLALAATFLLVGSTAEAETKLRGFVVIVAGFLSMCAGLFLVERRSAGAAEGGDDPDIEQGLQSLGQGAEFFAGSIRPGDLFRVIASRMREFVPFQSCALLLWDATRSRLRIEASCDRDMKPLIGNEFALDTAAAGKCLADRRVVILSGGRASVPLFNGLEPFAVLQFNVKGAADGHLCEAIGSRISPLVLRSLAFERSLSNALTDSTTALPNERALYLVLENQLAECQRDREARPLAVLAMDVAGFDGINTRFGHASGDRVLYHVAEIIKDSLRQMDLVARCNDDEFYAVLPTASREMLQDITARITAAFFGRRLSISDQDSIEVQLNIGSAAFGDDGETPRQLIAAARARKEAAKAPSGNVVWFSGHGPNQNAGTSA